MDARLALALGICLAVLVVPTTAANEQPQPGVSLEAVELTPQEWDEVLAFINQAMEETNGNSI